jgi:hypothetical protein
MSRRIERGLEGGDRGPRECIGTGINELGSKGPRSYFAREGEGQLEDEMVWDWQTYLHKIRGSVVLRTATRVRIRPWMWLQSRIANPTGYPVNAEQVPFSEQHRNSSKLRDICRPNLQANAPDL